MNIIKYTNNASSRLLLFFAGWSASPELFTRLKAGEGTDRMICYDYRDTLFGEELSRYKEIHLIAWSMGVRMAELTLGGKQIFTTATAINGTPYPIDDSYGIPVNIFRGTLDNLTDEGFRRFNRRMCGTREILAHYEEATPRPLVDVKEELQTIYDCCHEQPSPISSSPTPSAISWTRALIGTDDHIFPTVNQRNYWNGRCPITEIVSPHYPFYQWKQWNEL